MPWTKITRVKYQRNRLRYASDLTDREWALIVRQMPPRQWLGRPRTVDLREVVQAIFYILSTGCQWRALPKEFPPYSTVQGYFYAWRDTGRWQRIVEVLVRRARRKRHIVTDTNGLLLAVYVHPANVQDVHGAVPVLESVHDRFPKLRHVFADRVYRGKQLVNALSSPWTIEIVERPPGVKGFQLLPRRWVVERTFAWFGRCRRLAKDFEGSAATEAAWLLAAHLRLLTRRLART